MNSKKISDDLYRSLTIKERLAFIQNIEQLGIAHDDLQQHIQQWKEASLLDDRMWQERLQVEGLEATDFAKVIELAKDDEWIHTYHLKDKHKPDWMDWLDEALMLNRVEPWLEEDKPLLSLAFRPFTLWTKKKYAEFIQKHPLLLERVDTEQLLPSLLHHLVAGLNQMGARTIVLEMYISKQMNELEGETPEARYKHFVKSKLLNPDSLEFIYKEYPVLTRLLMLRTSYFIQSIFEALERFCDDWENMQSMFHLEGEKLATISTGLGDSHQKGRTVMRFIFTSNKVVFYKPKDLSIARHFFEFLDWMNEKGFTPSLSSHQILYRKQYAWEEYVEHRHCQTEQEAEHYYKRLGGLLAVLYALHGADFHYENMIADGEHPRLIDLETIFHHSPELMIEDTADTRAKYMIVNSVMGTSLLPRLYFQSADGRGIDLSGINTNATNEQELPSLVLRIENDGTDEMRFVRKKAMLKVSSQNTPHLNGKPILAHDYVDAIIQGFREAIQIIFENKEELTAGNSPLTRFKNDPIRVVIRATNYYGNFVIETNHPDYMRDMLEREKLLDRLWFTFLDSRQIRYEKQDLWGGDIPFFTTTPGSTDLIASSGERIPQYFSQSSYEKVMIRIKSLTAEVIEQQISWIEGSIASNAEIHSPLYLVNEDVADVKDVSPKERTELFLRASKNIGYRLMEQAIQGSKNDATWIGLETNYHGQWQVSALNHGLYNGLSGIALFFAYLDRVTKDTEFVGIVNETLESILNAPPQVHALSSAYFGQSSILHTLTHLAAIYGENDRWMSYMKQSLEHMGKQVEKEQHYNLFGGSAGVIQVLLNLYEHFQWEEALQLASKFGEHLVNNKTLTAAGASWMGLNNFKQSPLVGLSHGVSGITWSLFRLYHVTSSQAYLDTGLDALRYDRSFFEDVMENGTDLRSKSTEEEQCSTSWSHGAFGLGLSRILYRSYVDDPAFQQEIETAVMTTARTGMGYSHSLCHGDLGNAEFFYLAGKSLQRPEWVQRANQIGMNVLQEKKQLGKYRSSAARHIEVPGLFTGLSGIGYQYLRLASPDMVPSVLTLEKPLASV
ncbi:type 2 lantipeptide synthetase LanM [Paenibacillus agilis]|uniref:Type 2 lantipeptide synthetase LanM n=2 Tax=Paenibacillus agilis TaxID=3020863 RepID=A0A559J474_9BACL|nr:type 2 lantipeptide synthetase LanM [Paenibacillus agilis]